MRRLARRPVPTPATDLQRLRQRIRERAENRPAVYRMLDAEGRIIYVGKAKRLRTRLLSYFRAEYPDDKRNGEWEYAWFLPDGSRKADAQFDGCFECHMSRAASDYTFTYADQLLETER